MILVTRYHHRALRDFRCPQGFYVLCCGRFRRFQDSFCRLHVSWKFLMCLQEENLSIIHMSCLGFGACVLFFTIFLDIGCIQLLNAYYVHKLQQNSLAPRTTVWHIWHLFNVVVGYQGQCLWSDRWGWWSLFLKKGTSECPVSSLDKSTYYLLCLSPNCSILGFNLTPGHVLHVKPSLPPAFPNSNSAATVK